MYNGGDDLNPGAIQRFGSLGNVESRAASIDALLAELDARDIRLSLDGNKLRLNAPTGAVDDALRATIIDRKAELIDALRAASSPAAVLRPLSRDRLRPLSFAQVRLWFLDRMQPGTALYNIPCELRLRGTLDQPALISALTELLRRHESLRTVVRDDNGTPRAEVLNEVATPVRVVDVSHLDPSTRAEAALALVAAQAREPFDLARGPMATFLLVRCATDEHLLLVCMHHIAADGWSLSVATREICAVYDAARQGRPSPLPPLTVQYADFAAWQREQSTSGQLSRQLAYWQRELAGAPALLELPTDRPRPAVQSFRGAKRTRHVPADLVDVLKASARDSDVTLYMLLLSAWQVLMHRLSGQDDIVIGSPLANRERPELESMIGCFINNVVMRGRLEGNPRFSDFLGQVKATVLRAFDHSEVPFDRLVDALRIERSTSHTPIFQVLFTMHSFPMQAMRPHGLEVEVLDPDRTAPASSRFDLTLEIYQQDAQLRIAYEYATDLFDAATIDRMHAHYLTALRSIAANADQTVRDIPLLTDGEEGRLLDRINTTTHDHDRSRCIHDLVSEAADRAPEAVAVAATDETLDYATLERRANQLAHLLRAQGVGRGALVGVCLDRTSLLPVALLGVLKAGGAYVPLDPSHPADRLSYTLLDAQVACVISESRSADAVRAAGVPLLLLDAHPTPFAGQPTHPPNVGATPGDLAYVIYTSGSTGRPKGVEVEHRNVVNLLRAMQREPGIAANDVLLAVTTPAFDIAGLELFLPLVSGARTVIASRSEVLDGERLQERLESCRATVMQATPATWRLLIDAGWTGRPGLTALCGGEALPRDLARELATRVGALWNVYGPTETTIWSTVHQVTDSTRDIPIGHPIANTTVYVLDAAGRQTPIGVAGELCIGGEGVARGYRGRAELTAEKFVTIHRPGRTRERVYRTGDVVRFRGDLTLEFVGRIDHQVKLRGHRIELGEIESVLAEHPTVRRSVVIVRSDAPGDQRLVAYVVPAEKSGVAEGELRTLLRARLPEYMVPSAIVPLDTLPLTANGKVDRQALPVPDLAGSTAAVPRDTVMTEAQRRVAAIWRTVLRVEHVALDENFFDRGGHSLLVMQVHAALRREFGVKLSVIELFQRTTVAAQADLVSPAGARYVGSPQAQASVAQAVV